MDLWKHLKIWFNCPPLVWRFQPLTVSLCILFTNYMYNSSYWNSLMHITAQTISYLAFFILGRTHTTLMVFLIKTFPIFQDLNQMLLISKAFLSAFCSSFISFLHFSSSELPSSWTSVLVVHIVQSVLQCCCCQFVLLIRFCLMLLTNTLLFWIEFGILH